MPSFPTRGYTILPDWQTPIFPDGRYPILLMEGAPGYSRVLLPSGLDRGTLLPGLDVGIPHPDWKVVPPLLSGLDGVPPPHQKTEQQSKHWLCGKRYASCVHTGGHSCFTNVSLFMGEVHPVSVPLPVPRPVRGPVWARRDP